MPPYKPALSDLLTTLTEPSVAAATIVAISCTPQVRVRPHASRPAARAPPLASRAALPTVAPDVPAARAAGPAPASGGRAPPPRSPRRGTHAGGDPIPPPAAAPRPRRRARTPWRGTWTGESLRPLRFENVGVLPPPLESERLFVRCQFSHWGPRPEAAAASSVRNAGSASNAARNARTSFCTACNPPAAAT
jgi:hypothetical protein